ncbi:type A von willebrand factor domain protein (macronuclear) [Tetrahymena thermophila SB210]|uniref:Type A von willebrand factor domain protein n=1 Tax=Tetrahymena thermophila (strain SB210) TaxID=312017 RepID=I7M8J4_TETTS|nr:type A von willebrand factor domain protein [Tetrahymena thermophila SB210]EAR98295.1 type A von willebrand factor domain protein [Tetrahymena thermophila SB210]|eukprot:XP_001018540.1 type A von willebrand factor domain protein [Tetrahymena thermophila SB210]
MNNKFFGISLNNKKNFEAIPQLVFSNYQCKIINNILQVELTQRFQDQNNFDSNLKIYDSNEAIYYLPVDQNICIESFQATINGKTAKGVVKKINEAKDLYLQGRQEGNIVGYCEKKIFQREVGECLEIRLGNIPQKFCIDIKLKYSQQLQVILNTFYSVDLSLVLKESHEQINQNSFILDLLCSQKITFFKNFGISLLVQQVDENHTAFYTRQLDRSQTQICQEGGQIVQFKLIYQFENMHVPQVLYGACESQVHINKDDKSNKQIDVQNNSFMISFVPDFNFKFKSQINDAIVQSIAENQNIFSQEYLNSFNQQIIDQTDSSKCEFIFLLDRSGSMSGQSIQNAIEALILFIKSLPLDSYFNIYSFGTEFSKLFDQSQKYSNENVELALNEIITYSANYGGTNIYQPLSEIFNQPYVKGYGRQIYILTDGQIENKENVMHLIQSNNISNRVHAIGIGLYVDKDLIIQSAKSGKGCHAHVTDQSLIQESIINILQNSISPILEDVKLSYNKEIFNSQYPKEDSLYCLFKNDLFTFTLFLKSGIDFDSLNDENKLVKIQYFDTTINQKVEKTIILEPQDAHKYDPSLNKTVFKLGIHQKLCQLSNILKIKNQILSQEQEIQQLVNESIEHQILTSYTSYFCEIEQITDEKRIQYFVDQYLPQNDQKLNKASIQNHYNYNYFVGNKNFIDKTQVLKSNDLLEDRSRSRSRERLRVRENRSKYLTDLIDDEINKKKIFQNNSNQCCASRYRQNMQYQTFNDTKNNNNFNSLQLSSYVNQNLNSQNTNSFNKDLLKIQKVEFVDNQSKLQINTFSQSSFQNINNHYKLGSLDLQNIIKQVTVEGKWIFNQQVVLDITKCTQDKLEETLKLFQQKDLFMTILMIWILENYFQKEKQQWQMIANKSNKFIQQQINDYNLFEQYKQIVSDFCKTQTA